VQRVRNEHAGKYSLFNDEWARLNKPTRMRVLEAKSWQARISSSAGFPASTLTIAPKHMYRSKAVRFRFRFRFRPYVVIQAVLSAGLAAEWIRAGQGDDRHVGLALANST
jgi:hypothetical protein